MGDETGIAIAYMSNHKEIYEGNLVYIFDAVVRLFQGTKIIQTKFRRQKILFSPYKLNGINYRYNLSRDSSQIENTKIFTKISTLSEPPY